MKKVIIISLFVLGFILPVWAQEPAVPDNPDEVAEPPVAPLNPDDFNIELRRRMIRANSAENAAIVCSQELGQDPLAAQCGALATHLWEEKERRQAEARARSQRTPVRPSDPSPNQLDETTRPAILRKATEQYLARKYGLRDVDFEKTIIEGETEVEDFSGGIIGVGGNGGTVDRATLLLSYVDWIGETLNYSLRFTTGFAPDNASLPHFTLGGGLGLGARDKFLVTPYIDLGICFSDKSEPDLLMQYGVEIGFFLGWITAFFDVDLGDWGRLGIVLDIEYAYLPLHKDSSPGFGMRVGIAFPF